MRSNDKLTGLPAYLGLHLTGVGPGLLRAEMEVRDELLTPFGSLHGGVFAACTRPDLPERVGEKNSVSGMSIQSRNVGFSAK